MAKQYLLFARKEIETNKQAVSVNQVVQMWGYNDPRYVVYKVEKSQLRQNRVWEIIKDNDLKNNPDYSTYAFRNQSQRIKYEENGILPNGVPSIYKPNTVDFIIKIFENEEISNKE